MKDMVAQQIEEFDSVDQAPPSQANIRLLEELLHKINMAEEILRNRKAKQEIQ